MSKTRWWVAALIGVAITGSLYGSFLVAKERERISAVTISNNDMLKLIDTRIGSETEFNRRIAGELQEFLDEARKLTEAQKTALGNHEKIIQQINEKSGIVIKNQQTIMENQMKIIDKLP